MRIMITGSTGFVGSNLTNYFLENEPTWEVVAVHGNTYADDITRIPGDNKKLEVITWDLNNPLDLEVFGKVDMIFNIASESHVDRSIDSPVEFTKTNVNIALNIVEYARAVKPRLVFHMSTDEVVGCADPSTSGHSETAPLRPSNPYAASKVAQEGIFAAAWRTYQLPVVMIRSTNIVGPNQFPEKMFPKTIKSLLAGLPVEIHGKHVFAEHLDPDTSEYDEGMCWESGGRFWTPVEMVCEIIHFLSQKPVRHHVYDAQDSVEIYNICGTRLTNYEMAQRIAEILDVELVVEWKEFHAARMGHDSWYALDDSKLKSTGFKTSVDFNSYLRWIVSQYVK